MPIKFRCMHCQQLLGISRSRAGATVDCPQCGRTLRVPGPDGKILRPTTPREAARGDQDLLSALSELSRFSETDADLPDGDSDTGGSPKSSAGSRPAQPDTPKKSPVIDVEPLSASDPIDILPEESSPQAAMPAEAFDADQMMLIDEPLAELAALDSGGRSGQLSSDLLEEMRATRSEGRTAAVVLLFGLLLLPVTFAAGWWFGAFTKTSPLKYFSNTDPPEEDPRPGDVAAGVDGGDPSPGSGSHRAGQTEQGPRDISMASFRPSPDNVSATDSENGSPVSGTESVLVPHTFLVTGTVTYEDSSGKTTPDVGATVLLLPEKRSGTLKIPARSLTRFDVAADHPAAVAMLSTYGGAVGEVGSDGTFRLRVPTDRPPGSPDDAAANYQLIVVSRNLERPAAEAVSEAIAAVLNAWVDSPSHVCGRRRAKMQAVRISAPPGENLKVDDIAITFEISAVDRLRGFRHLQNRHARNCRRLRLNLVSNDIAERGVV
ncbi:MAG: hypothetical protein KDA89_04965 [Planctomycetaceae bacterium]|nr:hypothetical protein [Planctomycetaceae bacterium]